MSSQDSNSSSGGDGGGSLAARDITITKRQNPNGSLHEEISSCTTPNSFAASFSHNARKKIKKTVTLCTQSGLLGNYTPVILVMVTALWSLNLIFVPFCDFFAPRHQQNKSEERTV